MSQSAKLTVMISSTTLDLPDHRKEAQEACLRQGMFPAIMEHLPASDGDAVLISLKLVNEADIYIGIVAHRYGHVPSDNNPEQLSITEIEYNRAIERGIPKLIFLIDKTHPIVFDDIEQGEGGSKLKAFKKRLQTNNIVNFFKSPVDLRSEIINSLSKISQPNALKELHYISAIPTPPAVFVAHPYTLLQTRQLIGRQAELSLLTDWVTQSEKSIYQVRIMNVVAIGGMGKSALTWKWFTEIAPHEIEPLAGRMWWSFYESDASFGNFVIRALAYVSRRSLNEIQQIQTYERETQLLAILDAEPFLIVLDGLERILLAYARLDAAHLADGDLDEIAKSSINQDIVLPSTFASEHRLRKTADVRAGNFLRKLTSIRASRILVSTRLYPADLQAINDKPLANSFALFLPGLTDEDALDLWRASEVSGSRNELLPLFYQFEKHPLLLQALAGEVARYRRAPGNFDQWKKAHSNFNPFVLPLVQVKSHVLYFALSGLNEPSRQVLQTIAAFRSPASYATLIDLVIGEGRPCLSEQELDQVLVELEDRGLVGWDRRANRYDLHPIVRGVVWYGLEDVIRQGIYTRLQMHFEVLPMIEDYLQVNSLEDLTPAIELYNTLIGLQRYDEAWKLYDNRLHGALLYRLGATRLRIELIEMLFPNGPSQSPQLSDQLNQASAFNTLASGYHFSGQPGRASILIRQSNHINLEKKREDYLATGLGNLSYSLRLSGSIYDAEANARRAVIIARGRNDHYSEAVNMRLLGLVFALRGVTAESQWALKHSLHISYEESNSQLEGLANAYLAQRAKWWGDYKSMCIYANRAWKLASALKYEADFIRAARLQGAAALGINDLSTASEWLHQALTRAREVNRMDEELDTLIDLAELSRRQNDEKTARERLEEVWEAVYRGPYPLFHADALNILTQIERDAGNIEAAIESATKAYQLAWCDGPPYAYHWGLAASNQHLWELRANKPSVPLFYQNKFEPMPVLSITPDIESSPDIEFYEDI